MSGDGGSGSGGGGGAKTEAASPGGRATGEAGVVDTAVLGAEALSSCLDGLGIGGWATEHRKGFLSPSKWQEQAEAIKAIAARVQSAHATAVEVHDLKMVAHALHAQTHFEDKHIGITVPLLELLTVHFLQP